MSDFDTLAAAARTIINSVGSDTITYRRGISEITLSAISDVNTRESVNEMGVIFTTEIWEFLIESDDLIIGNRITPERGDQIDITLNAELITIEVQAPAGAESWFAFDDPAQESMRIYGVEINRQTGS